MLSINEVGFDLFHTSVTNGRSVRTVVKDLHILNLIESTVRQRLARFVVEQPECCAPRMNSLTRFRLPLDWEIFLRSVLNCELG